MSTKTMVSLGFIIGVAVGAAVALRYSKQKYEQIIQEEIDSVKETLRRRVVDDPKDADVANRAKEKPDIFDIAAALNDSVTYMATLRTQKYTSYSGTNAELEKEEPTVDSSGPYIISPEQFGEMDDYERISLTYYADQVLADENDNPIENVEEVVGHDSLNGFGEYEEDSVFVRNDILECDYEILLDTRRYSDLINRKPHEVYD